MSMSASLYEPINVYQALAADIGIVDGPFEYFSVAGLRMPMPFTTRMTVVRLDNGDLWLHSPIAYDEPLAAQLRELGRVRHLISPNQWHYAHIGEWQRAFPDAVAWASPGVRQRARARRIEVHFGKELGREPPPEWRDEIDQTLVPGRIFRDADPCRYDHESGACQNRSAVASVGPDQRHGLSAWPNLLRTAAGPTPEQEWSAGGV